MKENERLYFPGIDGLRFIAFLLVFFSHFTLLNNPFGSFLQNFGWIGVELFFLLSSFLLTKLLIQEYQKTGTIQIKKYFIRRILRIWPLYYAFIVVVLYFWYMNAKNWDLQYAFGRLIGLLTFTDNIATAVKGYNIIPFTPHLWSISLEEQFYLLLPFFMPLFLKLPRRVLLKGLCILWIYILILRFTCIMLKIPSPFVYSLLIQGDSMLLGIFLAFGYFDGFLNRFPLLLKIAGSLFLLGLLPFMAKFEFYTRYSQVYTYTIIAISFGLLFHAVLNSTNLVINVLFGNRVIRYLGKISYGLYVYHLLCVYFADRLYTKIGIENWYVKLALALGITILISSLSYELYEKRFLKLKEKYTIIRSRPL